MSNALGIRRKITPHKGGRSVNVRIRFTPDEVGLIDDYKGDRSRADAIVDATQKANSFDEIKKTVAILTPPGEEPYCSPRALRELDRILNSSERDYSQ